MRSSRARDEWQAQAWRGHFSGEVFTLTDTGEMSMFVSNIGGAPDLARQVIADATGALRAFITPDERAQGTGSLFGATFRTASANSRGRFFVAALLADGPARAGVFWDGPPRP